MPGYGMMWQPYLAGAGWDPFMNGAWMWYPGSGYAWISAYPVGLDALSLRLLDLPQQLWLVLAAGSGALGMEHHADDHESATTVCRPEAAVYGRTDPAGQSWHAFHERGCQHGRHAAKPDTAAKRYRRSGSSSRQCPRFRQGLATGRRFLSHGHCSAASRSGTSFPATWDHSASDRIRIRRRESKLWRADERSGVAWFRFPLSPQVKPEARFEAICQRRVGSNGGRGRVPQVPKFGKAW